MITGYVPAFASLVGIPIGNASYTAGLRICAITPAIKKFKWIIKEKRNKRDKIVLLGKTKLNSIWVLISTILIDWYTSHNKVVLVKNMLKKCNDMKEAIKNLKTSTVHQRS